jgi:hypothetical protein
MFCYSYAAGFLLAIQNTDELLLVKPTMVAALLDSNIVSCLDPSLSQLWHRCPHCLRPLLDFVQVTELVAEPILGVEA